MAQRLITLISLLLLSTNALALNLFPKANPQGFVPVDEAFPFDFHQQGNQLELHWQIKDGYYLYRHQLSVSANDATLGDFTLPPGKAHRDEFFGETHIFTAPLTLNIPIAATGKQPSVSVTYQGCAAAGLCYPPETRVVPLNALAAPTPKNVANTLAEPTAAKSAPSTTDTANKPSSAANLSNAEPVSTAGSDALNDNAPEQEQLASRLAANRWAPLLFFVLGLGLAFTPCVLPMFPLLSGVVLGGGQRHSHGRALALSLAYVQGMALTYTLLGLVVAAAGLQFQAALQHPYVLIGLSVLFTLLALSMFGLFSLQLPSALQTRLSLLSGQQRGGSLPGVFLMGAIAGLICSPCTTAPLSGALLYVADSGDLLTGGLTLYLLACGMGLPLVGVALFGNRLLPKSGPWMNQVKTGFGFLLLAMPVFLLSRLLPEVWTLRLWSLLALSALGWLFSTLPAHRRGFLVLRIAALIGMILLARPLQDWAFPPQSAAAASELISTPHFITIRNQTELQQALQQAAGKPVMLDLYAEWCVACKEFTKYTFSDAQVQNAFSEMVLLKADVTANNAADQALLRELNVLGLPTLLFFNPQGHEIPQSRVTGFMPASPFLQHLQQRVLQ
ncbi:protein-disulfide reductase DsbD [Plesiomonas shigelloides]|uniref:protein-disulfide reductase DsbD n=1 Tax=Plesiomonas shigelloides TaxID=703 RepID=UPI0031B78825